MPGKKSITLGDGVTTVNFSVETNTRLTVSIQTSDKAVQSIELPYPGSGYGGHKLVISPSENYLALYLYSGQSEVGYELFELRPRLVHIGKLDYVEGEGFAPVFAPDESCLAMASSLNAGLALEHYYGGEDGVEFFGTASNALEWAEVRLQTLPHGEVQLCKLVVTVEDDEGEDEFGNQEWDYPRLAFTSPKELAVSLPWGGKLNVAIPMPDQVVIEGPQLAEVSDD